MTHLLPLAGGRQTFAAACDDAHHLPGVSAEGGGTLCRIQHRQPSGGAAADVKQPATKGKGGGNGINGLCYLGQHRLHRFHAGVILSRWVVR